MIGVCAESHCAYTGGLAFPEDVEAGLRVGELGSSSVRYEIGLFGAGAEERRGRRAGSCTCSSTATTPPAGRRSRSGCARALERLRPTREREPMKVRGAVLREMGRPRPYAESRPLEIVELELDAAGPRRAARPRAARPACATPTCR